MSLFADLEQFMASQMAVRGTRNGHLANKMAVRYSPSGHLVSKMVVHCSPNGHLAGQRSGATQAFFFGPRPGKPKSRSSIGFLFFLCGTFECCGLT